MAQLTAGDLSLEIAYREACTDSLEHETARYEIRFLWKRAPLVRDEALKRNGDWWSAERPGVFLAFDFDADRFLAMVQEALDTEEPRYHETVDPDFILAIYPGRFFPFLKPKWKVVWESDELKQESEQRERLKEEKGSLPDDLFQVIAFVDSYNLSGEHAYSGDGLSLHLTVERQELERFLVELRAEYDQARQPGAQER